MLIRGLVSFVGLHVDWFRVFRIRDLGFSALSSSLFFYQMSSV